MIKFKVAFLSSILFLVFSSHSNERTISKTAALTTPPKTYLPVDDKILGIWAKNNFRYYKDTLGYTWAVAGIKSIYTSCKAVFNRNIMESLSSDTTYWEGIVKDYDTKLYTIDEPLRNLENWRYSKTDLVNAIVGVAHFIKSYRPSSELRIGVSSRDIAKYLGDYKFIAKKCSNVSFMYTSYDYPISVRMNKWKFVRDNLPVKAYYINAKYDYENNMFLALISYAEQLGANEIWLYCYDGEENLEIFNYYAFLLDWLKSGD